MDMNGCAARLARSTVIAGTALGIGTIRAVLRPFARLTGRSRGRAGCPAPPVASAELAAAPVQSRSAVVNGVPMRWEEHGEGSATRPVVVMVHGIPTSPRLWRYVIPHLTHAGMRCLAWEMVGYGWSIAAGMERDISVARQSDYLDSWLRHMGIERAILVGHDLGGGVVQRLLVSRPEVGAGVVLVDSIAYDNWPIAAVLAAQRRSAAIARVPSMLLEPVFLTALASFGHDRLGRGLASALLHWQPYTCAGGAKGLAHQLRSLDARDTLAIMHALPRRLALPARVVWGEYDPLGLPSAEALAADLKAPLQRILDARHFTPEDHPDLIAQAILEVRSDAA